MSPDRLNSMMDEACSALGALGILIALWPTWRPPSRSGRAQKCAHSIPDRPSETTTGAHCRRAVEPHRYLGKPPILLSSRTGPERIGAS